MIIHMWCPMLQCWRMCREKSICNSLLSTQAYNWVKEELEIMLKLIETMGTPKSQPEVTDFTMRESSLKTKCNLTRKPLKTVIVK